MVRVVRDRSTLPGRPKACFALRLDQTGSVLPMAAVGFLVLAALVGGGLDASRAYRAQNRLQSACDAAVLAGRKAVTVNGFDSAAEREANAYFNTNFNPDNQGAINTDFTVESPDNGHTVVGSAESEVETAIMTGPH